MFAPSFVRILWSGALGTLALVAAPPTMPNLYFDSPRSAHVGVSPMAFAVADFNGDGIPDLAIGNLGAGVTLGGVVVLLGNGDGTFQKSFDYARNTVFSVVVADFNGDGKLDIAFAANNNYEGPSGVSILLGNGDGTFQTSSVIYNTGLYPYSIAAGDFNGDGNLDLVVTNGLENSVSVLLGNGDGTFQAKVLRNVGREPRGVAVGDFNGDGKLDLVVAAEGINDIGSVVVLLGNGDGTFQPKVLYLEGKTASAVAVGDFNEDGILDLAVTDLGPFPNFSSSVYILPGRGDGTFGKATQLTAGLGPTALAVADFNGDGHLDLAIGNYVTDYTSIILGDGDGTFQPAASYSPGALALAVGDFTGSGKLDLVVAPEGNLVIMFGDGNGGFQHVRNYRVGGQPDSIAVGDFNGDGIPDLVVANDESDFVSVLLGKGEGGFRPQAEYSVGYFQTSVVVGDFNRDGKLDIAVAANPNQQDAIAILLGNGDGTFQSPIDIPVGISLGYLAVADFNKDGNLDLAFSDGNTISILLGNGDGTFQPPMTYTVNYGRGELVLGDFNGDGNADIAVTSDMDIGILLGNGDGTFQPAAYTTIPGPAYFLTDADFNGDGKLDLAVSAGYPANAVLILLGNGDGSFQTPLYSSAAGSALVVGDFNGDGKLDIAGADEPAAAIALGNGDGTFQPPVYFSVGLFSYYAIAAADFNHDGRLDLAVPNYNSGDVSILLNTTR